jgi:hypothetical protein
MHARFLHPTSGMCTMSCHEPPNSCSTTPHACPPLPRCSHPDSPPSAGCSQRRGLHQWPSPSSRQNYRWGRSGTAEIQSARPCAIAMPWQYAFPITPASAYQFLERPGELVQLSRAALGPLQEADPRKNLRVLAIGAIRNSLLAVK